MSEQAKMWVPVRVRESPLGTFVIPSWGCASDDKSFTWDQLIEFYREVATFSALAKKAFALPESRSAAIATLRRRGFRLLPATITLDEVPVPSAG